MKTKSLKLFLLAIILLTPNLVYAASSCSYEEQVELNDMVANVKVTYEQVDIYAGKGVLLDEVDENGNEIEVDQYVPGLKISILNIVEDIYVRISNNKNDNVMTYRYSDTQNGEVSFQTSEIDKLVTYTVEVYSNKESCFGELVGKLPTVTTPMYNNYSDLQVCNDNPEFYYCQRFIYSENVPIKTFFDNLEVYQTQKKETEKENETKNGKFKETIIIIIGSIVVVAGVATTVILIKKKRSRVL